MNYYWRLRLKGLFLIFLICAIIVGAVSAEEYLGSLSALAGEGGPLVWIGFTVLATLGLCVGIPGTAIIILAGIIFTFWEAYWLVLATTTLSSTIMFYMGRYLSELLQLVDKGYIKRVRRFVETHAQKHGFQVILIMRFAFVHYAALSYAAGFIRTVRFWPYFCATLITNLFYDFIFVFVGTSLSKSLPYILGSLGLALGAVIISLYIKHRRKLPE